MENRITALETRLDTILPTLATKADISDIRADLHKISSDTSRWMIATVISLFLGFSGLFFIVSNNSKAPAAPVQAAPIIIYPPAGARSVPAAPTANSDNTGST